MSPLIVVEGRGRGEGRGENKILAGQPIQFHPFT